MILISTFLLHFLLVVNCHDPELNLNTPDLIRLRGFGCEEHTIKTDDGYLLTAYRIVHPLVKQVGRPVILQHGVLSSSRDFLINSPAGYLDGYVGKNMSVSSNNLGFELANRGHDVWLTNTREKPFWKWSFDEMISYDIPNSIDYVIKATNHTTVGFIGHSQGSMTMFGLLSTRPIYNDIVKPFIALAPVTSVGHVTTPIRHLAKLRTLKWILKAYGLGILRSSRFSKYLSTSILKKPLKSICANLVFMACGYNKAQLNETRLDVYVQRLPAGTSSHNLLHYAQNVRSGKFEAFDHGAKENLLRYGSKVQPEYDLSRITNKDIVLMRADNDLFVRPKDLAKLRSKLKVPLLEDYRVPLKDWNHIDFIWAKEAGKYVNKKVVDILAKYE